MTQVNSYDYIIAGMGCAGLSLAVKLSQSDVPFSKILLIDKDLKNKNDRTWCFWTKEKNQWYRDVIFKRWKQFEFKSSFNTFNCTIEPYEYCMIRGIDFYELALTIIKKDKRFEILTQSIERLESFDTHARMHAGGDAYTASYIFNSAFRKVNKKEGEVNYVQHFKGWVIECVTNTFDVHKPVFMDFSVEQHNDCRFVYLLPFSENKALVEYTGFSPNTISDEEYNIELNKYIKEHLGINEYHLLEEEKGEIPMYESEFVNPFGNRVVNLGTASGASKTSTGFTFYFIQKYTDELVKSILDNQLPLFKRPAKYLYYDKILLDVIDRKKMPASEIFDTLFRKNKVQNILAFLNEESTLLQEIRIMNSVPKLKFIPSAMRKLIS